MCWAQVFGFFCLQSSGMVISCQTSRGPLSVSQHLDGQLLLQAASHKAVRILVLMIGPHATQPQLKTVQQFCFCMVPVSLLFWVWRRVACQHPTNSSKNRLQALAEIMTVESKL